MSKNCASSKSKVPTLPTSSGHVRVRDLPSASSPSASWPTVLFDLKIEWPCLPVLLCPGVFESHGAVEYQSAGFAVIVCAEVTNPLELEFVEGFHLCQ